MCHLLCYHDNVLCKQHYSTVYHILTMQLMQTFIQTLICIAFFIAASKLHVAIASLSESYLIYLFCIRKERPEQ